MLSQSVLSGIRVLRNEARRNFGLAAPIFNKVQDPIQQLFLEKLREYKSKSTGGKLVDATPEIQKELKTELERVSKQFGGGQGVDMTKFPEFKFDDVKLDPISQAAEK